MKSGQWDDDGPGWTKYPEVKEELHPSQAEVKSIVRDNAHSERQRAHNTYSW